MKHSIPALIYNIHFTDERAFYKAAMYLNDKYKNYNNWYPVPAALVIKLATEEDKAFLFPMGGHE